MAACSFDVSLGGRGRMTGVSGQSKFARYPAIGSGVMTVPTVSAVIPTKNDLRGPEHVCVEEQKWS